VAHLTYPLGSVPSRGKELASVTAGACGYL